MQARSRESLFPAPRRSKGLTILEVLVVIAVLGILAALLLPAISTAREAARRSECGARLKQLSLAMINYEENYQVFPGSDYKYKLLPYLDLKAVYDKKLPHGPDPTDIYSAYRLIIQERIPVLICPSESYPVRGPRWTGANYAGCYGSGVLADGYNGILSNAPLFDPPTGLPRAIPVRSADVTDGLSNTSMFSEMLIGPIDDNPDAVLRRNFQTPMGYINQVDLVAYCDSIPERPSEYGYLSTPNRGWPWFQTGYMNGMYNHAMTPNRPSCMNQTNLPGGVTSATSQHDGGVQVAFGDGHVEFVSNSVDATTWGEMGSRMKNRP